jgi:hypothetical protein
VVTTIGFTRICFVCDKKKVALGGTFNPHRKLWKCAGCSGNTTKWNMKDLYPDWNKGPPPSLGWWPVKNSHAPWAGAYRWWDGECWSWPAFSFESADRAARWAAKKIDWSDVIEWADRPVGWPERSKT